MRITIEGGKGEGISTLWQELIKDFDNEINNGVDRVS